MNIDQSTTLKIGSAREPNQSNSDGKACFDGIYTRDDPREYYRVLYGLDYIIPDLAKAIFRNTVRALEQARGRPVKVLDLGCSYGNNGILLRMPLDFHRLAQRYSDLSHFDLSPAKLMDLDRDYLKGWPTSDVRVIGLDSASEAIAYAKGIGAIDDGLAVNLETDDLTAEHKAMLKDVDLIVSTGCIGYVGPATFAKLLDAIETPPWVASFVLRMYPFDSIDDVLRHRGLITEKLQGVTFVQRRFHSMDECRSVLSALAQAGVLTEDKEDEGLLHAEFLLSRGPGDIKGVPLEQIANVTTGADHTFGRRYRRDSDNVVRLTR